MKQKNLFLLGVAALFLFAFKKKKTTRGSIELGDLDEGDFIDPASGEIITIRNKATQVLSKVNQVFADNEQPLQDDSYIREELNRLNDSQLNILDSFFLRMINGDNQINLNEVDSVLALTPNLTTLLAQGVVYNNSNTNAAYGQRFGVDDGMNLIQSIATGDVVGVISGVANLIDSLFCGKKCRARRAARIQQATV